ncbi:hypothetical protein AB4Z39_16855 [Mycobacterium adipatum]|uniref:hypothetical protein n=1 Tax=Mycobacterium adipatum TaxID=1682113 RepID=UPI0034E07A37
MTVESIPMAMEINDAALVREATERASAIRDLKNWITRMSNADKTWIEKSLADEKHLYDTGRWWDLPQLEITAPPKTPLRRRALWLLIAAASGAVILGVISMGLRNQIEPNVAGTVTLIFGVVFYTSLVSMGVPTGTINQTLDSVTKFQKGLAAKPSVKDS